MATEVLTAAKLKEQLRQKEDQIEEQMPRLVQQLAPALQAEGAAKRLEAAPRDIQEAVLCQRFPEFAALCKEAHSLNLRWQIAEGWY